MRTSLFERLINKEVVSSPSGELIEPADMARSIAEHLTRLFNTRQGTLPHLPVYGLPDTAHMVRSMPGSYRSFQESVEQSVSQFEPRINRFSIVSLPFRPHDSKICLEIHAQVLGEVAIRLAVSCEHTGEVSVKRLTAN
ncbi:MAG: type VI secretion system baseplate subunit TssE [Fibrobacteria bacterium]|nr:type VI secretion system baseplate subunit TssE [Fibrobacteria bacterium]